MLDFLEKLFLHRLILNLCYAYLLFYEDYTIWIDICPSNGNMLATGGMDKDIKIFDQREAKIVKTFEGIHSGTES